MTDRLADRYQELMEHRREILMRYGANELSCFAGPKARIFFPTVRLSGESKKRIGPLRFSDRPPIFSFVESALDKDGADMAMLEIGPGRGELAKAIQRRFHRKVVSYYAYDRDPAVTGPYRRLSSLAEAPDRLDVVVASEVIEHMTADELFADVLAPLASKMSSNGTCIVSTPNPLAPGGIARDFSHVQSYPWYDLYAIFRLAFEEVEIYRTLYIFDVKRVVQLLPRLVLCTLLELEWCDGLVAVATRPRADGR